MKYEVYHAVKPTFGMSVPKFPEEYAKVAIVEAGDLEDVFRLTNHIDEDWMKNPEVLETVGVRFRSTSVGDVVVDGDKIVWYCAACGWKKYSEIGVDNFLGV